MYSIFIPTYCNAEYLKLCVESILKNSYYPTHQLCIHVNGYDKDTVEYLNSRNLKFTITHENVGSESANHQVDTAIFDKVLITNDDCYFTKNWDYYLHQWEIELDKALPEYARMVAYRMCEPRPGAACPPVCEAGKTIEEFNAAMVNEYVQKHARHDVWGWNACALYEKDLWLNNRTTKEFYPTSCADLDYILKFINYYKENNKKYLIFGVLDSCVYHFQGISVSKSKIPNVENADKFKAKWNIDTETAWNLIHKEEDRSQEIVRSILQGKKWQN